MPFCQQLSLSEINNERDAKKIRRGKSFAGVVHYVLRHGSHHKNEHTVIGGNISIVGNTTQNLIAEYNTTMNRHG